MKMCCFGKPKFLNELFQKLKSRRGEDDDGLPSSPVTQSTQDVLDDFKTDKQHESKHSTDSSMYSSEDELDEKNVFDQQWVTASRQNVSPMTDSAEGLDLDVVRSTKSLTSDFAHHKIAVKPKNLRPSSRRPNKSTKTPNAKTLSQVEEKEETEASNVDTKNEASKEDKNESADAMEIEEAIQVKADIEAPAEPKCQSADFSRDADDEDEEENVVEEESAKSEAVEAKPVAIIIPLTENKASPKASPMPSQKSPTPQIKVIETKQVKASKPEKVPEEKKEKEVEPAEKTTAKDIGGTNEAKPFNVVLRKTGRRTAIEELGTIQMRKNIVDRNVSKRQTIAGDTGLTTIFSEWKPGNRNSFAESSRSPEPKEYSSNEVTQVLNRLKKQPSRKKLIPNEEETAKSTESEKSVERKTSQANKDKSVVVESKSMVSETKAKVLDSKSKTFGSVTPKKSTESRSAVPETRPKMAESKPRISESKPKIESKPRVVEVKLKISDSKSLPDHSTKSNESKPDEGKPNLTVITSKTPEVSEPKAPEVSKLQTPEVSNLQTSEVSNTKIPEVSNPKTPGISKSKTLEVFNPKTAEVPKFKEKEVIIISKSVPVSPNEPETKLVSAVLAPSLMSESVSEKKLLDTESKPTVTSSNTASTTITTTTTTTTTTTPVKSESSKLVIIEKAKAVDQPKMAVAVEKEEPKSQVKEEVKVTEKHSFKRESAIVKNRMRSQTLTEPGVQAANKSSVQSIQRSNSQGDPVNDKPIVKTTTPVEQHTDSGPTKEEPVWFRLARRKTANWDKKEKDLEQKEKKETSNIAEKKRDASSKGKEVTLTIDVAAKEDTKPTLRATVKCANSVANRQSKVLDMAKLFNQVS